METETIGEKSLVLEYGERGENFKGALSVVTEVIVKEKAYADF